MKLFRILISMNLFKLLMRILPKDSIEYAYLNQAGCNCVAHYNVRGGKDFISKK